MLSFNKVKIVLVGEKTHTKKDVKMKNWIYHRLWWHLWSALGQKSVTTTEKHSRQECLVTVAEWRLKGVRMWNAGEKQQRDAERFSFFSSLGRSATQPLRKFHRLWKRMFWALTCFVVLFFHFGTDSNCRWAFHLTYWSYLVVLGFSLFVLFLLAAGWVDFDLKVRKWCI